MRKHTLLLLLLLSPAGARGGVLDSWNGSWSPYRLTDEQGRNRRLLKAGVQFTASAPPGAVFTLRSPDGAAAVEIAAGGEPVSLPLRSTGSTAPFSTG